VATLRRYSSFALFLVLVTLCTSSSHAADMSQSTSGVMRTYYVAADEVNWDYAPSNIDLVSGRPFDADERVYTSRGPHAIGKVYRKVVYREYTDATFKTLTARPKDQQYLGILGPILHAEVGDTLRVVFKNNASRPYSMHPHGVFYKKDSEGMSYNDGSTAHDKLGGVVPPRHVHTYIWEVPERAGPGPNDPSSIFWLYHSHVNEMRDVDAGLIGAIVVTRRGMARSDGTPKDIDKEFVALYDIIDENQSWYLNHNILAYTGDPKAMMKPAGRFQSTPVDSEGDFSLNGQGFINANFRFTINGYSFGSGPKMVMKVGDHVRWYLATIGFGFNFHTAHWHGNTVLINGQRTDVVALSPAQMVTADMVPDDPGTWLFHCHVSDHMNGGMTAFYQVKP
jgi:manganese oxidase